MTSPAAHAKPMPAAERPSRAAADRHRRAGARAQVGPGGMVQGLAALLWLPQAALLAWAVQGIADGRGMAAVLWPALGIALMGAARSLAEAWGARRVFARARQRLGAARAQAVDALAAGSPLDRARPPSGLAASVLAEQAESLMPWLVRYQPARWRVMAVPPLIALAVLPLSWLAALFLVLAAPLIPLFMAIVGWRAQAASEQQLRGLGGLNAFLLDRLRGLSTLRALGAVPATGQRLRAHAEDLRRRTMAVLRIAFLSSAVLELFAALGVAMVAVVVGFHLLGTVQFGFWGRQLSLGEGLFVLLLAPAFFEPLRELSAVWHDRAAGEAALSALERLSRPARPLPGALHEPPADAAAGTRAAPSVRVHRLAFSHEGEPALFQGAGLSVAPGEHVALMGASGAGKTVLLSLVAGLLPAQGGRIEIDGVALDAHSAPALRARMAWIGQRPHVFAGSVADNIALGREGVSPEAVASAIRTAGLERVAQAAPHTALGEGGAGLSGGEALRLALARMAVATQAGLVLADEPTAHLDRETAAAVADALCALARGRTLIVATHDPLLAARMDRVVRIADGGLA